MDLDELQKRDKHTSRGKCFGWDWNKYTNLNKVFYSCYLAMTKSEFQKPTLGDKK